MESRKTQENQSDVEAFLGAVKHEKRRQDSFLVTQMMETVSGQGPKMWGTSIVGFGTHHYQYSNGRPAEICNIGFAPRANHLVFYLGEFDERATLLQDLGKHKTRKNGCIYVNKLDDVDLDVLENLFRKAYVHRQ
jgi:hypothetical protein